MITGILIAVGILIVGFVVGVQEGDGEASFMVTNLIAVLVLTIVLVASKPPKSDTEKLKELQNYCVSIGVATMTPVVTTTEFKLLSQPEYVTATGVIQIKGEAE